MSALSPDFKLGNECTVPGFPCPDFRATIASDLSNVLSVAKLTKRYHDTLAVDGISFHVARNEIVGLLGPNGAGKTTTINMILGVLEPTSGVIRIQGLDLA